MTTFVATKLDPIQSGRTCDKCGVQAQLVMLIGNASGVPLGDLAFCFHHGNLVDQKILTSVNVLDMKDNRRAFAESEVRETNPFLGDWLLQD